MGIKFWRTTPLCVCICKSGLLGKNRFAFVWVCVRVKVLVKRRGVAIFSWSVCFFGEWKIGNCPRYTHSVELLLLRRSVVEFQAVQQAALREGFPRCPVSKISGNCTRRAGSCFLTRFSDEIVNSRFSLQEEFSSKLINLPGPTLQCTVIEVAYLGLAKRWSGRRGMLFSSSSSKINQLSAH